MNMENSLQKTRNMLERNWYYEWTIVLCMFLLDLQYATTAFFCNVAS